MRKIRMGMIGGGKGSFMGKVHRTASGIDGLIELVCGAFSSKAETAKLSGEELFLPEDRVYLSFEEMIEKEKSLPADKRMDFVSIVTPNHLHFPPAMMALENGFHVVVEKPMTFSLEEAKKTSTKGRRNRVVVMPYSYLFRISDGKAGKKYGTKRRLWKNQKNCC